jgi:hypothetical protein
MLLRDMWSVTFFRTLSKSSPKIIQSSNNYAFQVTAYAAAGYYEVPRDILLGSSLLPTKGYSYPKYPHAQGKASSPPLIPMFSRALKVKTPEDP